MTDSLIVGFLCGIWYNTFVISWNLMKIREELNNETK
jgi:hypothetical protein